jgi:hypothetical protein
MPDACKYQMHCRKLGMSVRDARPAEGITVPAARYEGDGMIHTCWLRGPSQAVYSNQYVATLRLQEERRRQGKVFLRVSCVCVWGGGGSAVAGVWS